MFHYKSSLFAIASKAGFIHLNLSAECFEIQLTLLDAVCLPCVVVFAALRFASVA